MFKKILSNFSFVASGFFLHILLLMAFVQISSFTVKSTIMTVFLIPTLLTLLFGLSLRSFVDWQKICGIVIISSVVYSAFLFLCQICILYSPELQHIIDRKAFELFSDLFFGFSFFSFVLSLGTVFFIKGKST